MGSLIVEGGPRPGEVGPATDSVDIAGPHLYRPGIDGIRCLAVYLVVLFHAGIGRMAGGFIGVDVFFVLSGYLVTQSLERDLQRSGRVHLASFYSRRVLRLLPAAAVHLVATAMVFAVVGTPAELADLQSAIRAAALYVSNWYFISTSADYFGPAVEASPVAHYWSLSVEEQYYLIWPLLFGWLFAAARRLGQGRNLVRIAVGLGAAASLTAALWSAHADLNRAYYGTDTRAYQLLAGALLALSPGLVRRLGRGGRAAHLLLVAGTFTCLGGIFMLATSVVDANPIQRGLLVTFLTLGLLLLVEGGSKTIATRLLSFGPVVYLGRISYGTYLWHWTVILVLTRQFELGHLATAAVAAVMASGLASLSYQVIELPLLRLRRYRGIRVPVIVLGLAVSFLVGIFIAPWLLEAGAARGRAGGDLAVTRDGTPNQVDWEKPGVDLLESTHRDCLNDELDTCQWSAGEGPRILVVGDSHATVIAPMVEQLAERQDANLFVRSTPACPWIRGLAYDQSVDDCFEDQNRLWDLTIPKIDPDIIVLVHRPILDPAAPFALTDVDLGPLGDDAARREEVVRSRVVASVAELRKDGRRVLLVEPVPVPSGGFDPRVCLSSARYLEECRYVAATDPTSEESLFREMARDDAEIWALDLDRAVCPYLPICDPVVSGEVVKLDGDHLSVAFASTLGGLFEAYVRENGLLR